MKALYFLGLFFISASAFTAADYTSGSMEGYYTYTEIKAWTLEVSSNATMVTTGSVGKSAEGRDILYLRVGSNSNITKSDVLVTAETSTHPLHVNSVMYYFYTLLEDPDLELLLATRNVWFVPLINVDSYVQMEAEFKKNNSLPFYTKNRQSTNCSLTTGRGIELNRNFPFGWNLTTDDGCASNYAGASGQTATEVQVLVTLAEGLNLKAWIHFDGRKNSYYVPYSLNSSLYESQDIKHFYEEELQFTVPPGFTTGTHSKYAGTPVTGTLIDFAASLGALAIQIGSSSENAYRLQLQSEAPFHEKVMKYIIQRASFDIKLVPYLIQETFCSEAQGCVSSNSYSVVLITYSLENYGFQDCSNTQLFVDIWFDETPDYSFEVARVNKGTNYYESMYNSTAKYRFGTAVNLELISSSYDISFKGMLGKVPARSSTLINLYIDRVIKNNRTDSSKDELAFKLKIRIPEWSDMLNAKLPVVSDVYEVDETDNERKHYYEEDNGGGGMSKEMILYMIVYVLVGCILLVGGAYLGYAKLCTKPHTLFSKLEIVKHQSRGTYVETSDTS